jgi:hypothetical protein
MHCQVVECMGSTHAALSSNPSTKHTHTHTHTHLDVAYHHYPLPNALLRRAGRYKGLSEGTFPAPHPLKARLES